MIRRRRKKSSFSTEPAAAAATNLDFHEIIDPASGGRLVDWAPHVVLLLREERVVMELGAAARLEGLGRLPVPGAHKMPVGLTSRRKKKIV